MHEKLLSVIVPVYNGGKYIKECIDSIRRQSYQNIEIVIVDDGSIDDTASICKEYVEVDNRIKYFYQDNAGATAARTHGVKEARGEHIAFVDADDYIDAQMYEKMMVYVDRYDLVSCGIKMELQDGNVNTIYDQYEGGLDTEGIEQFWEKMEDDFKEGKLFSGLGSAWNKVYRKEKLIPILTKLDTRLNFAEDLCFLLLYVLDCTSMFFLHEPFYFYRYNEASATHSKTPRMLENIEGMCDLCEKVFSRHSRGGLINKQMNKQLILLLLHAVNTDKRFLDENPIPCMLISLDEFTGKKIAIYGAGAYGKYVYWQCQNEKIEIGCWVDRDYLRYQAEGFDVKNIETLKNQIENLDAILIAINNEKFIHEVEKVLMSYGIPREKIVWKEPRNVFWFKEGR